MKQKLKKSPEQRELVRLVLAAVNEGKFLTVGELSDMISYAGGYGSIRTSIRRLETHGIFVRVREGHSVFVKPTLKAFQEFNPD